MKRPSSDENALISFNSFLSYPLFFFNSVGLTPFYDYKDVDGAKTEVNSTKFRLKEIYFWVTFFELLITLILEVTYFFHTFGNSKHFLELTQLAPCMGYVTLSLTKMITVYLNRDNITNLIKDLYKLFPKKSNGQDEFQLKRVSSRSAFVMKYFTLIYMVLIWTLNLLPLIHSISDYIWLGVWIKRMPYFLWYPFDHTRDYLFEVLFILQIWAGFICAIGVLASDLFFFVFITHIAMQFEMLSKNITTIVFGQDKELDMLKVREYVAQHQQLIKLCGMLEQIFSPSFLINFIGGSLIICLVAFQLTAEADSMNLLNMFTFLLFLVTAIGQSFMLCWFGDRIIDCSRAIGDSIYETNWYACDKKLKKILLICMIRAHKPERLTAMKFAVISRSTFSNIIGTSYSYYTLLRTVYQQ